MGGLHLFGVCILIIESILSIYYLLFIASWQGHIEVVKELISKNADIEAKSVYGSTSLDLGIYLNY